MLLMRVYSLNVNITYLNFPYVLINTRQPGICCRFCCRFYVLAYEWSTVVLFALWCLLHVQLTLWCGYRKRISDEDKKPKLQRNQPQVTIRPSEINKYSYRMTSERKRKEINGSSKRSQVEINGNLKDKNNLKHDTEWNMESFKWNNNRPIKLKWINELQ